MAEQPQTLGPQSASTVHGHGHIRDGNGNVGRIIPAKRRLTSISVTGSEVEPETELSHVNEVLLRVENHTGAMSLNLTVSNSDTHADTNQCCHRSALAL
jgi:hypothetical protein